MGVWADLVEALLPIRQDGEPNPSYRWRQIVALSIITNTAAIILTNVLIWGYIPVAYSGVVSKSESALTQATIIDIRQDQVTRNLKEAKTAMCIAQEQGNMDALVANQKQMTAAYNEYTRLMKTAPRIPECSELVLASPQAPR